MTSGWEQASAAWDNRSRPPAKRACSGRSLSRYFVASRTFLMHRLLNCHLRSDLPSVVSLSLRFADVPSDSAIEHAGHAALCPSRAVLRMRTRRARSASGSTASASALDRAVSQAICYRRLCFLFALPRIGGRWFWPRMPRPGGPDFGLLAGDKLPLRASLWITIPVGPVGGVEAAPASAVAVSAVAAGTAVAADSA